MKTPLDIVWAVRNISLTKGALVFSNNGLVVFDDIEKAIVAGEPFLEFNWMTLVWAKKQNYNQEE